MTDWRHLQAEDHWAKVSQATRLAATARALDRRRRISPIRMWRAVRFVPAGARRTGPVAVTSGWPDAGSLES